MIRAPEVELAKQASRKQAARHRAVKSKRTKKRSTLSPIGIALRGTAAEVVTAVTRRVSNRGATDAIVLLETDHRRMEALLKRGEKTGEGAAAARRKLLDTITKELAVHETIEERVFYPALESHAEAKKIVLEGFEEHHAADVMVKELHRVAADKEKWTAKFKVLKETIEHHIDEEEGQMFRTARAVLSQKELDAMGRKMDAIKEDFLR